MTKTTFKTAIVILLSLGFWIGDAGADKTQLEEKLSKSLSIKLEDVTLTGALDQIGQQAGLKIALSPEAVWKLPDGLETRLSVTLDGRLGESLAKMLNSFFLRYAVGSDSLTIYPRPELKRIIGRPTAGELKLLKNLYTNAMWVSTSDKEVPDGFVQMVFNGLASEPVAIMPPDEIRGIGAIMYKMMTKSTSSSGKPHDPNAPKRDPNAPKKDAPLTIASLLEAVEQVNPAKTWYIEGVEFPRPVPEIRIVSKADFQKACLDQIIDVSFSGEKGESVVRKLATWAGLEVQFSDPNTARALAPEITLEVQNVKLVDALNKALSTLGVVGKLKEGVLQVTYLTPASEPSQQATSEPQTIAGGYVGKISIPMDGGRYFIEFMLRESDLTDELRALRQEKIKEILAGASKAGQQTQ